MINFYTQEEFKTINFDIYVLLNSICMKKLFVTFLLLVSSFGTLFSQSTSFFNITPSGTFRYWQDSVALGQPVTLASISKKGINNIGLMWWEARDIQQVAIEYTAALASQQQPVLQYWQSSWPQEPPKMPSVEDIDDDQWNGHWITAATQVSVVGKKAVYSFQPMTTAENKNASFLPTAVTYRRTLKLRLLYPANCPLIKNITAYSSSRPVEKNIRVELGTAGGNNKTSDVLVDAFNGAVKQVKGWQWTSQDRMTGNNSCRLVFNGKSKGLLLSITAAEPLLPGSNDETVVTLRTGFGNFSFSTADLDKGPVYIPNMQAYITRADDTTRFATSHMIKGKTILERIGTEQEQNYDRAKKEIPALDPWQSQYGTRMYMPLAADGNWQKFGIEWGGNFFLNKEQTKAQGKELARCNWQGTVLSWQFGTGDTASIGARQPGFAMNFLDNYLPVISSVWRKEGLVYEQEFFTTLLSGPLSPFDTTRDEQVPSILMVKMTVSNPSTEAKQTSVFARANEAVNKLVCKDGFLYDEQKTGNFLRCYTNTSDSKIQSQLLPDKTGAMRLLQQSFTVAANGSTELYFYFPFVGDLSSKEGADIAALNYEKEKTHVTDYWRKVVSDDITFRTPERKFNEMSKAVIPHIRMSATRDPKSHLFMVPASSIGYGVYANEACFQIQLLDKIGDFKTAAEYLKTFVALQGSRKLPGDFTGDQKDVYYGVRVDSVYDQTFNGYNMHHGTTLWTMASHYLYSKDKDWLQQNISSMTRAADWLIDQRKTSMKGETINTSQHYGLLPAGVLEDPEDWQYWFTTNAYGYLAINTLAKAMQAAGMPGAAQYAEEARLFREDIRRCVFRASEEAPVIPLRNGIYVPFVPVRSYQHFRYFGAKKSAYYERYNTSIRPNLRLSATREVLYGPVTLIKTGIISPDESLAQAILQDWEDNITISSSLNLNTHGWVDDDYWFSRGGMVFQANLQNPASVYLSLGNVPAAIRSLYNSFVSCLYPDVNVFTEEFRMWEHGSGPFYKVPDEARSIQLVNELLVLEKDNQLLLAPGTPRRWLEPGEKTELLKLFTTKGKLSFSMQAGLDGNSVMANVDLSEITSDSVKLFVRTPSAKKIKAVLLNGEPWKNFDADKESIQLPAGKKWEVKVLY